MKSKSQVTGGSTVVINGAIIAETTKIDATAEHDLGAGGVVTAEKFAVELEKYDGTKHRFSTAAGVFETSDPDLAGEVAEDFMDECRANGSTHWMDAYVVTADGSEA